MLQHLLLLYYIQFMLQHLLLFRLYSLVTCPAAAGWLVAMLSVHCPNLLNLFQLCPLLFMSFNYNTADFVFYVRERERENMN